MNKERIKGWAFWMVILLLVAACREEHIITPKTATLVLTGEESKAWQQTGFRFAFNDPEQAGVDTLDLVTTFNIPRCQVDNVWTFKRPGRQLEITEGATKCNPDDDDLIASTVWELVHANAALFIGGGEPFTVFVLNENKLQIGFRDTLFLPVFERNGNFLPIFEDLPGNLLYEFVPQNN